MCIVKQCYAIGHMTMSMSFKGHFIIAKNVDGQNLEYTSYSAYYTILE